MDRRRFLRCGAAALAAGTAGCAGDNITPATPRASEREPTASETGDAVTRTPAGQPDAVVEMNDDLAFVPAEIEIAAGDTIGWTNVGSFRHTVTAYEDDLPEGAAYFASGGFDSEQAARVETGGYLEETESYAHTFETEGAYEYYCIPHETAGMVGTVEVR